jgi:type III secretion system YscQ/HrcQ family protein
VAFPKDVDRNFLLAALAQTPFPKVADFGHLALPYALTVGGVDLTFDEIAHLTVGDLLIPDDPPILAGQAFYAPLDFSAKSFSPRPERAGGPAVPNAKETPVADPKAPAPTAPEPETSAQSLADNLSLPLSFEVGRKTLTVRELESLAPGAIIAVDHDPTQPVTVACHGQPVARGTLVDLGDGRLGVALTAVLQGVGDPLSQAKSRNE